MSFNGFLEGSSAPSLQDLQLYEPADGAVDFSPGMTLSELYRLGYAPIVERGHQRHPDTCSQNAYAVRLWASVTGDPPLARINQLLCAQFAPAVARLPKVASQTTVYKHCAAVQKVLDFAGPASRRQPYALGILERVPTIPHPPKEEMRLAEPYTLEESALLLANVHLFKKPRTLDIAPRMYWRALFLWLYATGCRIQESIKLEWAHVESHAHGDVARIVSRNRKRGRKGHIIELNEHALAALATLRGLDPERVFPWPRRWASKSSLLGEFLRVRKLILPPHRVPIAFHGFRRLHNVELARINPQACAKSLGHGAAVNAQHYIGRELVREAVGQLPSLDFTDERQLRLFE